MMIHSRKLQTNVRRTFNPIAEMSQSIESINDITEAVKTEWTFKRLTYSKQR